MNSGRRRVSAPMLLLLPALLVLTVFLLVPYLNIFVMSFRVPGQGVPYA